MATTKRSSAGGSKRSRVTRLYLLVCAATASFVFGDTAVAAVDGLVPQRAVSIEQMLAWHRELAESIAPAVQWPILDVRARP